MRSGRNNNDGVCSFCSASETLIAKKKTERLDDAQVCATVCVSSHEGVRSIRGAARDVQILKK